MKRTIYHNCLFINKNIIRVVFISLVISLSWSLKSVNAQVANPDSIYNIGNSHYRKAEYDKSATYFQRSADAYLQLNDSLNWANSLLRKSDAMMNRGNVREALDLLLVVNQELPSNSTPKLIAATNRNLGRFYRELQQYEEAKEYYQIGIEYAEASGDSSMIAILNNNIAFPYLYTGDYDKAIYYQQKAKAMYESLGNDYALSFVLNGIFLTLRDLNLHEQANTYIRKSMAIREGLDNPDLKDVSYHNMALNFNDLGKRDSAIIFYHKSLEISRMLDNPFDITQTLLNIGLMYEQSGDYDKALAYYNEALQTNYKTKRPVSIANNLMRLANVAILNDDLDNARMFYNEALSWLEQTNSPKTLANLYLNLARLEIKNLNFENAKGFISEAFSLSDENGFQTQEIQAYTLLGELYNLTGESKSSLKEYKKAYELSKQRTLPNRIFPSIDLAKAYHSVDSDSAYYYAEEAFTLIDSIRTNVAGLTFRSGFFSQYAGFYNKVASWHVRDKNFNKAYDLIESAKARVLMDELAEAENKFVQQLDESTLIKKQQMSKQIDQLYNRIYEAEDKSEIQALNEQLKDLEFNYQSFINEIRQNIPEWKRFEYPEPLSPEQIKALIPDKAAILEYAYAGQDLMIFLITSDEVHSFIIDDLSGASPKDHLTELISSYRDKIIGQSPITELNAISQPLYEILVKQPLSTIDIPIDNLVVVPEGNLTFLPFEALYTGQGYLIEDFNLKYLPSASIYPFIQSPHRPTQFDMLAVAGSGFTVNSLGTEVSSQNNFASLPSTLIEVESITQTFNNTKVLKNDDVTEAGLKSHDLSQFRFLHFATHGNIDELNPSQSGLILSKKAEIESLFGEDGYLNSSEISGLTLNADLVTLSACNTGMGKIVTGEGLIGLQRSFLSAGASSVMVSLWSIYDRSTADFMSDFYSMLKIHESADYGIMNRTLDWFGFYEHPMFDYKAKALRDAKLAMISHPYYSHPVHWAPFILIGK